MNIVVDKDLQELSCIFDDLENLLNVATKDLRECKNILLMTNSDSKKLIDPITKILDE